MSRPSVPAGFAPHFRQSRLTDPWEPLYSRRLPDRVQIGLVLTEAHCNSRGLVHGGLMATLADNSMGLSCVEIMQAEERSVKGLVTISLSTDYMSAAKLGQWLLVDTDYVKCGGSICFARAMILADGNPVAKASATFKRA